jgi:hypothetical protein
MRRVSFVPVLLAFGLAVGPAFSADPRGPDGTGSRLALAKGKGLAVVTSAEGSLLGTIVKGSITFTNYQRGAATKFNPKTWGCEKKRRLDRRTILCTGNDLHFSIVDGAWQAALRGRGIAASAVVRGKVKLRGTRGTYQIDDGPKTTWPRTATTFKLG